MASLTKRERLAIVFERLRTGPRASSADEARVLLDSTLVAVEDEFSGIPATVPPPAGVGERMYPALPDRTHPLTGRADVIVMEHRHQSTYLRDNGAILIVESRDGKVLLDLPGIDGRRVDLERP